MISFIQLAESAARLAGETLLKARRNLNVEFKGEGRHNLVSNADREAELVIKTLILEKFPQHQILAEESGLHKNDSPCKWVIDPLDGTTNFIHGFPFFCVSIGLEINGAVELGVVFDPVRREMFSAERGKGAFLNGNPIQVSEERDLQKSLLVTGFSYDIRENPEKNFDHFYSFSLQGQAVRRTGSAALDLCYTAAGIFDGYWELTLSPWDMAAGSLIVQEAGGVVTDLDGNRFSIYQKNVIASNSLIHDQMIGTLRQKKRPLP